MVIRQTDGSADGEQPSHVVDQGAAGLDQQETESVSETGSCALSTHNSGSESVTDAHQDTTDGQCSNGKHKSFAELLQILHHKSIPPKIVSGSFPTRRRAVWFRSRDTLLISY